MQQVDPGGGLAKGRPCSCSPSPCTEGLAAAMLCVRLPAKLRQPSSVCSCRRFCGETTPRRQSRTSVRCQHLSACLRLQDLSVVASGGPLPARRTPTRAHAGVPLCQTACRCLWLQLEETRQREDIQKAKQDRDAMLAGKATNIARIRCIAHAQATVRRHQAQERQEARAVQVSRVQASWDERASSAAHCARLQCCLHSHGSKTSLGSARAPGPGGTGSQGGRAALCAKLCRPVFGWAACSTLGSRSQP